jgi:hypothetical protein
MSVTDMGRAELETRLLEFDKAVELLYPNKVFRMVLVGGSALILLGAMQRATTDIDVLVAPSVLQELMAKYDINSRVVAYQDSFSDNIEDRLIKLNLPTHAVEFYSASLEDLVASKLCSTRDKDEQDIRQKEIIEALNWTELEAIIKDMEISMFSPRGYKILLFNYRQYLKECKK